jgi:hypothetical protein
MDTKLVQMRYIRTGRAVRGAAAAGEVHRNLCGQASYDVRCTSELEEGTVHDPSRGLRRYRHRYSRYSSRYRSEVQRVQAWYMCEEPKDVQAWYMGEGPQGYRTGTRYRRGTDQVR